MPSPSTRRDILSAYLASATKVASWALVSALTYRRLGPAPFALLALVRSTLGLLNYTSLGLTPALIHHLAQLLPSHTPPPHRQAQGLQSLGPRHSERSEESKAPDHKSPPSAESPSTGLASSRNPTLPYATPSTLTILPPSPAKRAYTTAIATSVLLVLLGFLLLLALASNVTAWLRVPTDSAPIAGLVFTMGTGLLARILSDPAGAVLQTSGRIALDNLLLALSDLSWALLLALSLFNYRCTVEVAGVTFFWSNVLLLLARYAFAHRRLPITASEYLRLSPRLALSLLSFGLLVTLAQLADYLYAPTDFLLINHLLPSPTIPLAAYAPCVQLDAALLLLVTALSTVLLPKAALAHARNDTPTLRRYYLTGTLASTALLLIGALATWLLAPTLLRLWLHDIPPGTLSILPLVLIHTVLGGSAAIARSILLGTGKVKPFTASVLLAGLANVLLSYLFVRHLHLGLPGIVLGTICAVTARCALWTPWYTLRTLRHPPTTLPTSLPPELTPPPAAPTP